MGLFGKIGDVFQKIELEVSSDPAAVGQWFENHVEKLFSKKYFRIVEKTHSFKTDTGRFVESNKNPDFIFEYMPTGEKFAVECKFRTQLNNRDQLEWSYPAQIKRYQDFERERKIPVFIIVGLDLEDGGYMFNIPLTEAKYPALYESVFAKYERDPEKPFFWKNGKLF